MSLKEKLIKIGTKSVSHSRYLIFQLAEVAFSKELFSQILERIDRLREESLVSLPLFMPFYFVDEKLTFNVMKA